MLVGAFSQMLACASVDPYAELVLAKAGGAVATNVLDCRALLKRPSAKVRDHMVAGPITLLSWNIGKGSREFWERDLRTMALGKELVILQEVVLNSGIEQQLPEHDHASFSRGFTSRSRTTGVATYSKRRPTAECQLSVVEPLLRSRKATSITEFAIEGRDDTLLVVNVHAVNFSVGLGRFRAQMEQIRQIVSVHDGPAIVSGDFNTWRRKRGNVVRAMVDDLALSPVYIADDRRKRFNGHALDHFFIRGLSVGTIETKQVTSSDHNPISVELRL